MYKKFDAQGIWDEKNKKWINDGSELVLHLTLRELGELVAGSLVGINLTLPEDTIKLVKDGRGTFYINIMRENEDTIGAINAAVLKGEGSSGYDEVLKQADYIYKDFPEPGYSKEDLSRHISKNGAISIGDHLVVYMPLWDSKHMKDLGSYEMLPGSVVTKIRNGTIEFVNEDGVTFIGKKEHFFIFGDSREEHKGDTHLSYKIPKEDVDDIDKFSNNISYYYKREWDTEHSAGNKNKKSTAKRGKRNGVKKDR